MLVSPGREQEFVASAPRGIAGAGFLFAEDGEVHAGLFQQRR
jgi:hypothetical protein